MQSALYSAHRHRPSLDQSVTCLSQHHHQLLWYFHQGSLRRDAAPRGEVSRFSCDILRSRVIFGAALVWELLPTGDCRCLSSLKRSLLDYSLDFDVISHRTRVVLTLYWCFCIRLKRCKLISELVEASTNSSVYRLTLFEFYLSEYLPNWHQIHSLVYLQYM